MKFEAFEVCFFELLQCIRNFFLELFHIIITFIALEKSKKECNMLEIMNSGTRFLSTEN